MYAILLVFFFNDTATTEIYTLSLHDALPISPAPLHSFPRRHHEPVQPGLHLRRHPHRSEEHTSELQSPCNLVCRLLLEKKKKKRVEICLTLPETQPDSLLLLAPLRANQEHVP